MFFEWGAEGRHLALQLDGLAFGRDAKVDAIVRPLEVRADKLQAVPRRCQDLGRVVLGMRHVERGQHPHQATLQPSVLLRVIHRAVPDDEEQKKKKKKKKKKTKKKKKQK